MEAVILAGGLGTRLRAAVPDLPKPMASIAGRPFLEIVLASLARKGFSRIILSLGHMAEKVVSHFGSSFDGMTLVYEIEASPLGTGGALRQALARASSDHIFVFNGDTFLDLEVPELESFWQAHRLPTIVGKEVADTRRYGRLETVGQHVVGFAAKNIPGPGLINAGCYVLPRNALDMFEPGRVFSLEADFLVAAVRTQQFALFTTKGFFIDIGIPDDYLRAQTQLVDIAS
ncbi:MAG TPA: nucleotidyltransferase family protein [Nitrosospira sp.]|nr:nucleotidyltransferase family protein [Nitrosospira sp.]